MTEETKNKLRCNVFNCKKQAQYTCGVFASIPLVYCRDHKEVLFRFKEQLEKAKERYVNIYSLDKGTLESLEKLKIESKKIRK